MFLRHATDSVIGEDLLRRRARERETLNCVNGLAAREKAGVCRTERESEKKEREKPNNINENYTFLSSAPLITSELYKICFRFLLFIFEFQRNFNDTKIIFV
jgi:hypothetical protein